MNEEDKEIALKIANELLEECEYSIIYEDERLEDLTENDWKEIHGYITHDLIAVPKSEWADWITWKNRRTEKFRESE